MASNRLLFCTGEGIGNVVQTIPAIRTLKEVLGYEIDFWHAFGSFKMPKIIPHVDRWIVGAEINNLDFSQYIGMVSTFWTRNHMRRIPLPLLNKIMPLRMDRSEVDIYMDIARDLGARDFIWHGTCSYNESGKNYDAVIHNGYNPYGSADWKIKSYPHYGELVTLLKDPGKIKKICSVGIPSEYIVGTYNETGKDLLDTLGVIKNAKIFVGNDSGLYHCANALGIPNVVIFTATSIKKNYDARFHKYSTIIGRDDLECRPCQNKRRWARDCKTWNCQDLDPAIIYNSVMDMLKRNI